MIHNKQERDNDFLSGVDNERENTLPYTVLVSCYENHTAVWKRGATFSKWDFEESLKGGVWPEPKIDDDSKTMYVRDYYGNCFRISGRKLHPVSDEDWKQMELSRMDKIYSLEDKNPIEVSEKPSIEKQNDEDTFAGYF